MKIMAKSEVIANDAIQQVKLVKIVSSASSLIPCWCPCILLHCGPEQPSIQTVVLHWATRLFIFSFVRSLIHFTHSLARGTVNVQMAIFLCFLFHSGPMDHGVLMTIFFLSLQCKDEVTIHYCLGHHPFIVQVFHYWQSKRNLYIIMEFVPHGELFALWQKLPHFPEVTTQLYAHRTKEEITRRVEHGDLR